MGHFRAYGDPRGGKPQAGFVIWQAFIALERGRAHGDGELPDALPRVQQAQVG